MKTNFSVLFFLKRPKNYTNGAVYFIFLRITVDGVRAEMSTSRNCEPERWNAKAGKVTGTKEDVKTLNALVLGLMGKGGYLPTEKKQIQGQQYPCCQYRQASLISIKITLIAFITTGLYQFPAIKR